MTKLMKVSLIIITILALLGIGYLGYYEYTKLQTDINQKSSSINEKDTLISDLNRTINGLNLTISEKNSKLVEYEKQIKDITDPYYGWKTYTSKNFGLSFKYNDLYSVVEQDGYIWVYGVFKDQLGSADPQLTLLLKIARQEDVELPSRADPMAMAPNDLLKQVKVDGKIRMSKLYYFAGTLLGGIESRESTYFIQTNKSPYFYVLLDSQTFKPTAKGCRYFDSEDDYNICLATPAYKYAPTTQNIKDVKLILESIKITK